MKAQDHLKKIDDWIRQGKFDLAKREIEYCSHRCRDRENQLKLAAYARRAGIPHKAISILSPRVRPDGSGTPKATVVEKVEYAAALIRIGATHEALKLLKL